MFYDCVTHIDHKGLHLSCNKIKNHKPTIDHIRCDFVLDDLVCLCVLCTVGICSFDPL